MNQMLHPFLWENGSIFVSFYQMSLQTGVDEKFLYEVLGDFYIKTNDVVLLRSESSAKCFAGFPTGYTVVLGGLDELGHTSVNPLSFVMLELYHEILLPQPNLSVRMNELIPRRFCLKLSRRFGWGQAFHNYLTMRFVFQPF